MSEAAFPHFPRVWRRLRHRAPRQRQQPGIWTRRRLAGIAFTAFFCMGVGWSLAMPVDATTDERQHIIRAYGAVSGQILQPPALDTMWHRPGAVYSVPSSLLPPNANCLYFPNYHFEKGYLARSASCQKKPPASTKRVELTSWVGRYNPVYYLAVGFPLIARPNVVGILAGRVIACALSAAFLAGAVAAAARLGSRRMLTAVILAFTPAAVALASAINPNGLEITAAIGLWAGLLALLRCPDGALTRHATRRLLLLCGTAGVTLLTLRALGPLWFLMIVASCAFVAVPGRIGTLLRMRAVRLWGAGLAVAGILGIAWNIVASGYSMTKTTLGLSPDNPEFAAVFRTIVTQRVGTWLREFVIPDVAPDWLVFTWVGLTVTAVVPILLVAERRRVLAAGGVLLGSLAVTVNAEIHYLPTVGWSQYGRYFLPMAVGGLFITAADRGPRNTADERFLRLVVASTAGCQLWTLSAEMTRAQAGPNAPINPLVGSWHPLTGSLVPLLAELFGLGLLCVLSWHAGARELFHDFPHVSDFPGFPDVPGTSTDAADVPVHHPPRRPPMAVISEIARRKKLEFFLGQLGKHERILEVGCADGWVGSYAVEHGWTNFIGIDICDPGGALPHDFVHGDINDWAALGLEAGSFDAIIAFEVIEHGDFYAPMHELLRPGGRLLVTTPVPRMDWACKVLERLGLTQRRTSPHTHLIRLKDLPSGFRPVEISVKSGISQWGVFEAVGGPRSGGAGVGTGADASGRIVSGQRAGTSDRRSSTGS